MACRWSDHLVRPEDVLACPHEHFKYVEVFGMHED
jgi:hypothetical protein